MKSFCKNKNMNIFVFYLYNDILNERISIEKITNCGKQGYLIRVIFNDNTYIPHYWTNYYLMPSQ
jgi:hypothetical protein